MATRTGSGTQRSGPTKGDRTRQRILEQAAPLLNARGYRATTLADLMAATGLEKGGIYNHFGSKDDLVLASYDRNAGEVRRIVGDHLAGKKTAPDRLVAVIEGFRSVAHNPPFPGGCPSLNSAVQSHDSDPRLRGRVQEVFTDLLELLANIAKRGVERKELRKRTDPESVAGVIVTSLEGGLLLSELYGDPSHMDRIADHLLAHVATLTKKTDTPGRNQPTEEQP